MISIKDFCDQHIACVDGTIWALQNCQTMLQAWNTCRPDWLIWIATRPGVLPERELRLFAVWAAHQVQHLMTDPRSLTALDVAERYADGKATDEELAAARDAAWDAARDAASAAASAAAWAAAWAASAAARDAARASARAAAWDAAWDAARDAARASAWASAELAAKDAQAAWLRANTKPNFS